jgi:membrane associated rhomboid family serine protease
LLHLFGNLAALLAFGRNVERALGRWLFLAFYLGSGVAAGLVHVYVAPNSAVPCIGASGAISAVIGAYVFIFPFNWMRVWVGVAVIDLPAIVVVGVWVVLQVVGTLDAFEARQVTAGVAYWVHVAGFVAGYGFVLTLLVALRIHYAITPRTRARKTRVRSQASQAGMSLREAVRVRRAAPDTASGFPAGHESRAAADK